ncbi:MAG: hypothetical protein HY763_06745 [Planctomycetes bacterium]|nr:hypothetical protein [Planctomycetota bacterium]
MNKFRSVLLVCLAITVVDASAIRKSASAQCQLPKLLAPDRARFDYFGRYVAVDGDVIVVGSASHEGSGAAFVYRRRYGNTWTLEQELKPTNGSADESYGVPAAICGDMLIVGASGNDTLGVNAGAVAVLRHDAGGWREIQRLYGSDTAADDVFGSSVALSADTLAVGAIGQDEGATNAGAVYLFRRTGDLWVEEQKIPAPNPTTELWFGSNVALDRDVLAITPFLQPTGWPSESAYIFRCGPTGWAQELRIGAPPPPSHSFGYAIALSDDWLLVGAPQFQADEEPGEPGVAFAYRFNGSAWVLEQTLFANDSFPPDSNEFGMSVAIRENIALIGAKFADSVPNGAVYKFAWFGTRWVQSEKWSVYNPTGLASFGGAMAFDGAHAVVGDPRSDEACPSVPYWCESGSASVYRTGYSRTDLSDFSLFQKCYRGPDFGLAGCCGVFDTSGDGDSDLEDYRSFLRIFTAPGA